MKGLYRFSDWPLRAKVAVLLIGASLLPLIAATVIDIGDARSRLQADTAALLAARGDQLVGELDTVNDSYQHAADRIAHVPNVQQLSAAPSTTPSPADAEALHRLLKVLPDNDSNVMAVAILGPTGVVRAASQMLIIGANLGYREFVQQALTGVPVTSDIHFAEPQIGSLPATAFAAPILSADQHVVGLAVLWVRATALWDVMKASNNLAGPGSFAVLFDQQGIRIAHTYSADILFHPGARLDKKVVDALVMQQRFGPRTRALLEDVREFPEQYERAIAKTPSGDVFRGFSPVNRHWNFGIGRRLRTAPWTVFYMIPESSVLSQIAQMTRKKLEFASLITLLALVVGTLVAANILNPVRDLSTATQAIAAGDLSARVPVQRADELGRLGAGFNTMAGRIEAQAADLLSARNDLEARVLARTEELARTARSLEQEILERTRAQESSRASQQLLEGIVGSSNDAIISKTLDGVITSWNPGAGRLFGFSAQEAIGQSMQMLIPPERREEEVMILARVARGESVDHLETVRLRADKTPIEISATISPVEDSQGRIVGASQIARDITERKLHERKVREQLERLNLLQHITRAMGERQDLPSIFHVVLSTIEDQLPIDFGCICLRNPPEAFLTVTCVGPRSAAIATGLGLGEQAQVQIDGNGLSRCVQGQLVYEPDVTQVFYAFPQRLSNHGFRSLVVAPLVVESQVFGVLVAARRKPHGFSSGECEFLKQLTEHTALAAKQAELYGALKTAYEDLRRTQQAVMQQERLRALGQMASGIAHDINNAISPITLYADALLEKEPSLSSRARNYLRTIQRAIGDVADTVSRMKEFYRDRGEQLAFTPIHLNAVAQQVVELTRARWSDMALREGAVIEVSTDLADNLPEVMGVESEIREALTNLILNAVDALPNGGKIVLRTRFLAGESNSLDVTSTSRACLEVIDTGLGMDENTRQRCLEPFFTTKGEQGTGLGLAMVYGTVQRHDAEMDIESAPGLGTTMRLSFPLPRAQVAAVTQTGLTRILPARLRILIVDDDLVLLNSLREVLEHDGHTIVIANGGQLGLDTFTAARERHEEFSVVITDLGMPYVDGRKVAATIKAISPSTPIILLTGWGQRLEMEANVPPHIDRMLSKPPKLAQLRVALAELTTGVRA